MTSNLKTVADFAATSPFSEQQCRWMIFKAAENGLKAAGVIVRIGRRVYIDTEAFERWVKAQQAAQ